MLGGYINKILGKGRDQRTVVTQKNIIISFFVKGISIFNNLLLVPFTINYVNAERYGIWLTVSSIVLWLNFFDFGLGNGLRNRLTEAVGLGDLKKQKQLLSTGYTSLFIVALCLGFLLQFVTPKIHWSSLLGVDDKYGREVSQLIGLLSILYCFQFVIQIINVIFYAFQKSALVSLNFLLGSILSLIFIAILKQNINGSLIGLGLCYFGGNIVSMSIFTLYFFIRLHPELRLSISLFSLDTSKSILTLGSRFFVVQLAGIIQYQAVNIIISRYFSPLVVTEYNIAFKYFSTILMIVGILMTPIWSAVSDAYAKKDIDWILKTERRLIKSWGICALLAILMLIGSNWIYKLWIGDSVKISFTTSFGVFLYTLSMSYGSIYVNILNGLGKLRTQFIISIFSMFLFIPITYLLAVKLNLGLVGISIAMIISNVNGLIAAPHEFKKMFKKQN
ncbi:hypothetical protein ACWA1C_22175 [Flectobacillus roseus]